MARVKQGGVFSKAALIAFGPPNSTERSPPTVMPLVFLENGVGVLCTLGAKIHPSGPRAGDKVLSLQP